MTPIVECDRCEYEAPADYLTEPGDECPRCIEGRLRWQPRVSIVRRVTADCSLTPPEAAILGNCAWCGQQLPRTKSGAVHKTRTWCRRGCEWAFLRNHKWNLARKHALKRDGHRCVTCGAVDHLEVNHIHSLKDQGIKGYAFGCQHHLANLETLCRQHHVVVTKAQRDARKQV